VISNPAACTAAAFNPQSLRCPGGADSGDACLSDAQLAVVNSWTTPAVFANGTYRNAGWALRGNEDDPAAWPAWVTGAGNVRVAGQYLFQDTTVKNYLARNPVADSLAYVPWDQDRVALDRLAALNDASDTDLRPFKNGGGKLILWHGLNDAAVSDLATTEYYQRVIAALGGQPATDEFVRYYLAPGVNHCVGGPGR